MSDDRRPAGITAISLLFAFGAFMSGIIVIVQYFSNSAADQTSRAQDGVSQWSMLLTGARVPRMHRGGIRLVAANALGMVDSNRDPRCRPDCRRRQHLLDARLAHADPGANHRRDGLVPAAPAAAVRRATAGNGPAAKLDVAACILTLVADLRTLS